MTLKCERCGIESEVESMYSPNWLQLSLHPSRYCPLCKKQVMRHRRIVFYVILGIALSFAVEAITSPDSGGWDIPNVFIALVFIAPMVVLHELSHVVVGVLSGQHISNITIGKGKQIFKSHLFGIDVHLNAIPFSGEVRMATPPSKHFRFSYAMSIAAGPAFHMLAIIILVLLFNVSYKMSSTDFDPLSALLWTNIYILLSSFWPGRVVLSTGPTKNDFWHVLGIIRLSNHEIEDLKASYYVQRAIEASNRNQPQMAISWAEKGLALYPENPAAFNGMGTVLTHTGDFDRARCFFDRLLKLPRIEPEQKFLTKNNVAYADLMTGDTDRLVEADIYSTEAYRNLPWHSAVKGTRGAILVQLGRIDPGIRLLINAFEKAPNAKTKALEACHLAFAEKKRGNEKESERYIHLAKALDPNCVLIDWVNGQNLDQSISIEQKPMIPKPDGERYCHHCGTVVFDDWLFCPSCEKSQKT